MKKVLIVEEFIPHTGGGRTEKFVKYLRDYGWEPVILTTKRNTFPFSDEVLKKYYPPDLQIYKVFKIPSFYFLSQIGLSSAGKFINNLFYYPDTSIGWVPFALFKGVNIIKKEKIQVIYTSSPNESTHLIGYFLKKIFNIKWVADFRDLWTLHPLRYFSTKFHLLLSKKLEQTFYDNCDVIVTCNEPIKDLISNHFNIDLSKINVITNGFDPEDFKINSIIPSKEFKIGYMGSYKVFGRENLLLNFLKAFSSFVKDSKKKKPDRKIVLNLWSKPDKKMDNTIQELNIKEYLVFHPLIPHAEVISQLIQQDLLLLLTSTQNDILIKTESTQKLLNYIATGIPILAIGAETGIAAKIIYETNTGFVCNSDIEQITLYLAELYQKWEKGNLKIFSNKAEIEKYNRQRLTKNLAQIFNQLTIC